MPAESQPDTNVFAEVVDEDAPVDDHVMMRFDVPDLLVDDFLDHHDVLNLFVGDFLDLDEFVFAHLLGNDDDNDLVVVDLLDLDLDHIVHVDVVDHFLLMIFLLKMSLFFFFFFFFFFLSISFCFRMMMLNSLL